MPRLIAASPVICRLWPTRDTIRWSLSKWPSLARFTLTGVSSYIKRISVGGLFMKGCRFLADEEIKMVNTVLERLFLEKHPNKIFIGRASQRFDFPG